MPEGPPRGLPCDFTCALHLHLRLHTDRRGNYRVQLAMGHRTEYVRFSTPDGKITKNKAFYSNPGHAYRVSGTFIRKTYFTFLPFFLY